MTTPVIKSFILLPNGSWRSPSFGTLSARDFEKLKTVEHGRQALAAAQMARSGNAS